jgi:hypothetical protein
MNEEQEEAYKRWMKKVMEQDDPQNYQLNLMTAACKQYLNNPDSLAARAVLESATIFTSRYLEEKEEIKQMTFEEFDDWCYKLFQGDAYRMKELRDVYKQLTGKKGQ